MKKKGQMVMLRLFEVWTIRKVCLSPLELVLGQVAKISGFPKVQSGDFSGHIFYHKNVPSI